MQPAMIPEALLEQRRRLGHDRFDEVWEGVLHMVPFPTSRHQRIEVDLVVALKPIADRRGLVLFEGVGLYDPNVSDDSDYRGPDVLIVDRRHVSKRGVEGNAHVVIEILSPHDESRDKLPFYARIGVQEVWLLDPRAATIEILSKRGQGYVPIERSAALSIDLDIEDHTLCVRDGEAIARIDLTS